MTNFPVLLSLIESLGIFIAIICIIPRDKECTIKEIALIISIVLLLITIDIWYYFDKSEPGFQFICQVPIIPDYNLNLSLGVDGISLCFLLLTTFIMPICIFAAGNVVLNYKQFVIYLLLIELFLILSFTITNLFFFYVFFESVLIPMFIMIGVWGARERKINAAYYFFYIHCLDPFFYCLEFYIYIL